MWQDACRLGSTNYHESYECMQAWAVNQCVLMLTSHIAQSYHEDKLPLNSHWRKTCSVLKLKILHIIAIFLTSQSGPTHFLLVETMNTITNV